MTMPPSFVDRPLIPCPPLRTANGTSCARANARASLTASASRGRRTSPGEPA